jgi:hypothetical protein
LITEDRLEKIRARAAAASPPPWTWRRDPWLDVYLELEAPTGLVIEPALWDDGYKGFGLSPADAEFLEHARQDVDDLLDDACCQADAIGELYGGINGDLLDAAANALKGGDA